MRTIKDLNSKKVPVVRIGNFFRSLFGSDQHADDADLYAEAVRRGGYLVTVNASSPEERHRAANIMYSFNPVDLDQRAS